MVQIASKSSSHKHQGKSRQPAILLLLLGITLVVIATALLLLLLDPGHVDYQSQRLLLLPQPELTVNQQLPSSPSSSMTNSSSPYVCSAEQEQGKHAMQFFEQMEMCGGFLRPLTIPDEGFIFAERYFLTDYETRIRDVFTNVLSSKTPEEISKGIVLDIGGNSGWYAAYASACFGIQVHVFEPQEGCLDIMCPLLYLNNLQPLVTIHHNIVASTHKAIVLEQGCDVEFSPDQHLVTQGDAENYGSKLVTSVAAADFVQPQQPVWMIKIDVEGTEIGVLQSLEPLLQDGRARNIVVEIKPKGWARARQLNDNIREFKRLVYQNHFSVYSLEKKVYVEPSEFAIWLFTMGWHADNNFWLQKQESKAEDVQEISPNK